jgi:hypothetical protein
VRGLPSRPLTTTVTVAATGGADADEVWQRYSVPARWSQWSPQISRVECPHPSSGVEPGLRGVVHGPVGVTVRFTVTDVDVGARRWSWEVAAGLARLQMRHGVDDAAGSARAWVRITGALPLVVAYAPAARLALGRLVADRMPT